MYRYRYQGGKWFFIGALAGFGMLNASGCGSWEQNVGLAVGITAVGGHSPNNEIEQIYYLGVFDPQEQVPPTVYRIRVHGQASFISNTRFASGWVRADLIDSLNTTVGVDVNSGKIQITRSGSDPLASLKTGRRLMMFGPEGFREAPKDHRLVIVMGASPESFFQAMDEVTGAMSQTIAQLNNTAVNGFIIKALGLVKAERDRLDELTEAMDRQLGRSAGAQAMNREGES